MKQMLKRGTRNLFGRQPLLRRPHLRQQVLQLTVRLRLTIPLLCLLEQAAQVEARRRDVALGTSAARLGRLCAGGNCAGGVVAPANEVWDRNSMRVQAWAHGRARVQVRSNVRGRMQQEEWPQIT